MQEIKNHLLSVKMKQVFLTLTILLATLLFFPFSLTQARELATGESTICVCVYISINLSSDLECKTTHNRVVMVETSNSEFFFFNFIYLR